MTDAELYRDLFNKQEHINTALKNELNQANAEIARLQDEVKEYKKQRDTLGLHTVKVYEALDVLLEASEECDFDDVIQKVAPIELWNALEEALAQGE
jgi:hypothetical protein